MTNQVHVYGTQPRPPVAEAETDLNCPWSRGIRHRISVTAQRRQCEHTYQARPKRIHRALDLSMVVHWLLGGPPPPGSSCGPPRPNRSRFAMKTPSATATPETSKIVRFLENRRSYGTAT